MGAQVPALSPLASGWGSSSRLPIEKACTGSSVWEKGRASFPSSQEALLKNMALSPLFLFQLPVIFLSSLEYRPRISISAQSLSYSPTRWRSSKSHPSKHWGIFGLRLQPTTGTEPGPLDQSFIGEASAEVGDIMDYQGGLWSLGSGCKFSSTP